MKQKIKKILKNILPNKILMYIRLKKIDKRKNKSAKDIENEINEIYKEINGRNIDWSNPKAYTEKLNVSKVYNYSKQKTELTDKVLVRNFIKEKIGEEYLIPLIGVYDKFEDIDFEQLPEKFVIKCNHDSGSVNIINDKRKINKKQLKNEYNFFIKRNYAYMGFEMHYKDIKPKIMIEKNMGDNIKDYKFLCFDGIPYYCWVDVDRFINHKRNIYDMDWKLQSFSQIYGNYEDNVECPKNFEKMKEIAKKLSQGFDHVRVDLYEIDGKVYFGEMTFTSESGLGKISPEEYDYKLGELWKSFDNSKRETKIKKA